MRKPLHIYTVGNIAYQVYVCALIESCINNLLDLYKITVLCDKELKDYIDNCHEFQEISIRTILTKEAFADYADILEHELYSTHFDRLLIPTLLHKNEVSIYLDADTLVLDNLDYIRTLCLFEPFKVACVVDYIPYCKDAISNYKELNIPGSRLYYNTGVIVFNSSVEWSDYDMMRRCFKTYIDNIDYSKALGKYSQYDQYAINVEMTSEIFTLPIVCNYPSQMPTNAYVSILHFLGATGKPDASQCNLDFKKEFNKYNVQNDILGKNCSGF